MPVDEAAITNAVISVNGQSLRFLYDLYAEPTAVPAAVTGPIAYRGYCAADALGDVRGKVVICHGSRRAGMPSPAERAAALAGAGAAAVVTIADPGFTVAGR